jgi:hypothetical protein
MWQQHPSSSVRQCDHFDSNTMPLPSSVGNVACTELFLIKLPDCWAEHCLQEYEVHSSDTCTSLLEVQYFTTRDMSSDRCPLEYMNHPLTYALYRSRLSPFSLSTTVFEPQPSTLRILKHYIAIGDLDSIKLLNTARCRSLRRHPTTIHLLVVATSTTTPSPH